MNEKKMVCSRQLKKTSDFFPLLTVDLFQPFRRLIFQLWCDIKIPLFCSFGWCAAASAATKLEHYAKTRESLKKKTFNEIRNNQVCSRILPQWHRAYTAQKKIYTETWCSAWQTYSHFAPSLLLSILCSLSLHITNVAFTHTHSIRFKDFQFNPSTYLYVYR